MIYIKYNSIKRLYLYRVILMAIIADNRVFALESFIVYCEVPVFAVFFNLKLLDAPSRYNY